MAMQVVAIEARRQPVTESLRLPGTVSPNEFVEIKSETQGIVQEIAFDEGQRVEKGALLVRLDETKFAAALEEAEANFKLSAATFARTKQLFEDKLISQQEYDQAAALFDVNRASVDLRKRQLKDARIVAPFAGRTGARQISPGQVVSQNTVLTWLVDVDPVKVELDVPERFLAQLREGQKTAFGVKAYPGRRFEGEVYFIAPQLDLKTRTALVKALIPNPDHLLKGGMVADLELRLQVREQAVVIPEAALLNNGDRFYVFLVDTNQTAQIRPVSVGERLPGWAEITRGLEAGERVIVEGHQKIGPNMPVMLAGAEKAAPYAAGPGGDVRSTNSTAQAAPPAGG